MSREVDRWLNLKCKNANWMMISYEYNVLDLTNVVQSVPVKIHEIVMPIGIPLANYTFHQDIRPCPCQIYVQTRKIVIPVPDCDG